MVHNQRLAPPPRTPPLRAIPSRYSRVQKQVVQLPFLITLALVTAAERPKRLPRKGSRPGQVAQLQREHRQAVAGAVVCESVKGRSGACDVTSAKDDPVRQRGGG